MSLITNPNFNPKQPESTTNQRFVFGNPTEVINPETGQTAGQAATGLSATDLKSNQSYINPNSNINQSSSALDLTANVPGLMAQMTNWLAKEAETYKAGEAKLETLKPEQTTLWEKIKGLISGQPSASTLLGEQKTKYGVDTMFTEIQGLLPEVSSLRDELNKLKTEEATMINNLYGQGRGITLDILKGQEGQIQRQYAIRQNAVSSELSSKAALMTALQGNITLATQLASAAVEASLYDVRQKVEDYQKLFEYNDAIINDLSKDQRDILTDQYNALSKELETKTAEKNKVADLMVTYPTAGISIADTYESAVKKASPYIEETRQLELRKLKADIETTEGVSTGLYDDIMQMALDSGASPSFAALKAVEYAEARGINISEKQRNTLIARAQKLTPNIASVVTPTPITAEQVGRGIKPYIQAFHPVNLWTGTKEVAGTVGGFFKGLFGK